MRAAILSLAGLLSLTSLSFGAVLTTEAEIRQAVMESKNKSCSHQRAKGNRWIATFQPPERIAANKKPSRHVTGGDAPLAPCEREVTPQFAERMGGRQWNRACFRHGNSVLYCRR